MSPPLSVGPQDPQGMDGLVESFTEKLCFPTVGKHEKGATIVAYAMPLSPEAEAGEVREVSLKLLGSVSFFWGNGIGS